MSCALRFSGLHSAARVLRLDSRLPREQAERERERNQDQTLFSGCPDRHSRPPVSLHNEPLPSAHRVLTACRANHQHQHQHGRLRRLTAISSSYYYSFYTLATATTSHCLSIRNRFNVSVCDDCNDFEGQARRVRGKKTTDVGGVRPLVPAYVTGEPQQQLCASFPPPLRLRRWRSQGSWEHRARRRRLASTPLGDGGGVSKMLWSLASGSSSLFRGLRIPSRDPEDYAAAAAVQKKNRGDHLIEIQRNLDRDPATCHDDVVVFTVAQGVVAEAPGTNRLLPAHHRKTAAAAAAGAVAAASSPRRSTKLLDRDWDRPLYARISGRRRGHGEHRERSWWSRNVDGGDRATSTIGILTTTTPTTTTTTVKSHAPEDVVYTGPAAAAADEGGGGGGAPKRITLRHVLAKFRRNEPITMVTAYDYPSAVHVDLAGIDILLVGDSVGMVVHGYDSTLPVTMEDMLTHCRAVARGARRPLLVGDLPFGSYEQSPEQAVGSAIRMLKEGSMDVVKLEGGSGCRTASVRAIVDAGIAVMGHVGLTPQAISVLGGFRPQGKKAGNAMKILDQALALQEAGCFAIVLECLPSPVAAAITSALQIPTIGIGAGPHTSGQVLVYHDLLGMMQHPHHAKVTPKFSKRYAEVGKIIQGALTEFRVEVVSKRFPSETFSPYRMEEEEVAILEKELRDRGIQVKKDRVRSTISSSLPP